MLFSYLTTMSLSISILPSLDLIWIELSIFEYLKLTTIFTRGSSEIFRFFTEVERFYWFEYTTLSTSLTTIY
jgi:hypothetical protein